MVSVAHQWNPDEWEMFALTLLQARHGTLEVHKIPATHQGDFGIDFYCTAEAVIYQCFAVEEPVDILTRANRQKSKITTDLKKMVDGASEVSKLFLGAPVKKWILLAPDHDSKEVNLHCAKKTTDLRALNLAHLNPDFEVGIHDQQSFPGAALAAAMAALTNISLSVEPRQQSSSKVSFGRLLERAATRQRSDQQVIVSTSEDLETLKDILSRIKCAKTIFPGYVIQPVRKTAS